MCYIFSPPCIFLYHFLRPFILLSFILMTFYEWIVHTFDCSGWTNKRCAYAWCPIHWLIVSFAYAVVISLHQYLLKYFPHLVSLLAFHKVLLLVLSIKILWDALLLHHWKLEDNTCTVSPCAYQCYYHKNAEIRCYLCSGDIAGGKVDKTNI